MHVPLCGRISCGAPGMWDCRGWARMPGTPCVSAPGGLGQGSRWTAWPHQALQESMERSRSWAAWCLWPHLGHKSPRRCGSRLRLTDQTWRRSHRSRVPAGGCCCPNPSSWWLRPPSRLPPASPCHLSAYITGSCAGHGIVPPAAWAQAAVPGEGYCWEWRWACWRKPPFG